ncbi:hypothetical protein F5J12DRAFT_810259 [Pisolithus orientalis]|uniref:uncharacterized protein n=1 Tax=Pisolithus orientalis TaxID=936130 RepID=UPI002224A524|nr:uncharacterized protein F5J12DRAFT_810259 [Pisolithus orientalis]KAI6025764.1 hypothetical protein F5J12DRAFT_810259 [Pisolithus orientalis]
MDFEEQPVGVAPTQDFLASIKVFPLIPYLKKDVISSIDTPLSWDQLTASDINFAVVRPLVLKYARLCNMAVVYACMVVRSYFLTQAVSDLAHASVSHSRATLCEIMALKLLNHFAASKVQLVAVLTTPWNPLAGAPMDIVQEVKEVIGEEECRGNSQSAIEMAIATQAKAFLSSPIVQTVVNDVYTGRVIFSIAAIKSVVADNYKQRAIEIYDVRKAPFLDHYRLRVPRYSAILHFMNIAVLLLVFVIFLQSEDTAYISLWEGVFLVFAVAFTLQEYTASREYGWLIYMSNVWNAFDTSFVVIFLVYLGLRIKGLVTNDADASQLAFDILACAGCILVPRLAFYAITNNVVILALRAMISEFVFFICIAATCFSGLLLTLYTIANGKWTMSGIAWLIVQIWFGNTSLSFNQAKSFHSVLGPILMTCFAALSNTLLLTILISILSNTAARIDANATQEYLFQYTISTIEGVKSDALFSYQPPFNLLALLILKPATYLLSPRQLHSANVFLIKLTSFPILVVIALYERWLVAPEIAKYSLYRGHIRNIPVVDYLFGSRAADLYSVIFQAEDSRDFGIFDEAGNEESLLSPMAPSTSCQLGTSDHPENTPRRQRVVSTLTPLEDTSSSAKVLSLDTTTPLSKFFRRLKPSLSLKVDNLDGGRFDSENGLQRLQSLLEECRELPVTQLKDEIRDLQDRQVRIEGLLLSLTRGIRNDTATTSATMS